MKTIKTKKKKSGIQENILSSKVSVVLEQKKSYIRYVELVWVHNVKRTYIPIAKGLQLQRITVTPRNTYHVPKQHHKLRRIKAMKTRENVTLKTSGSFFIDLFSIIIFY